MLISMYAQEAEGILRNHGAVLLCIFFLKNNQGYMEKSVYSGHLKCPGYCSHAGSSPAVATLRYDRIEGNVRRQTEEVTVGNAF